MQIKNLTVLILTYKRHSELKKKIFFLKKYNFNFLIIDGSPKALSKHFLNSHKKINYYHYPTENYHERIFFATKFIKTKYVKIESDNDYFIPSAMLKSIKILDKEKKFSAVIGNCGLYSKYKKNIYVKHLFKFHENIKQEDLFFRSNKYMQNYSPALYHSVCRTFIFKKNVKLWKKSKKIYGQNFDTFAEICLPLLCCFNGKIKHLDYITWIRCDDNIRKRIDYIAIRKAIGEPTNYYILGYKLLKLLNSGYLNSFISLLIKEMPKTKKDSLAFKKLKLILKNYYTIGIKNKELSNNFIFKIIKVFKLFLSSAIKKKIRFFLQLNGPLLKDIYMKTCKVDYKFNKTELKYLNYHLIKK